MDFVLTEGDGTEIEMLTGRGFLAQTIFETGKLRAYKRNFYKLLGALWLV